MSDLFRAAVLGIIQGLTEFLPVSSSGHLELAKYFLGDTSLAEESMLMTVTLHAATALSTIVIFRKDIARIFEGLFQFQWNEETRFSLKIILSMVPAAAIGIFWDSYIESLFDRQVLLVGMMLVVTGLLLFLADRARLTNKRVSFYNALVIGVAQAVAILPGISRSGATISTSVMLGIDREQSARFSFLMVVPLILGKMAMDLFSGELAHSRIGFAPLAIGFVAAFLTGALACVWMIRLVKSSKLGYFSLYCFIIAAIAIAAFFFDH
ncbi:MAG: undecaprenyl-diphosphate phosphatase [Phaeodactylibacter sp.]|nr:undecaprenyl-diphosphate phosphatase [Phaeodactylibacter sp.]MCB9263710.1 undecaprenyl-diphosphate phosphatase [Lewinellaceae bacterium]MCB9286883.1 undecaprenyl-diphosphate phosphatase [Lewinellaceae bacterium]